MNENRNIRQLTGGVTVTDNYDGTITLTHKSDVGIEVVMHVMLDELEEFLADRANPTYKDPDLIDFSQRTVRSHSKLANRLQVLEKEMAGVQSDLLVLKCGRKES